MPSFTFVTVYSFLKEPPAFYDLRPHWVQPWHSIEHYSTDAPPSSATRLTASREGHAGDLSSLGHLQGGTCFPWPTLTPVPSLWWYEPGSLTLHRQPAQTLLFVFVHRDQSLPSNQLSWMQHEHLCSSPPSDTVPGDALGGQLSDLIKTSHRGSPELSGKPKPGQRAN